MFIILTKTKTDDGVIVSGLWITLNNLVKKG